MPRCGCQQTADLGEGGRRDAVSALLRSPAAYTPPLREQVGSRLARLEDRLEAVEESVRLDDPLHPGDGVLTVSGVN